MYLSTLVPNPSVALRSVDVYSFLFGYRGFKLVGPFIVMIYNMIAGDLLRFLIIYLIFLLGFSQGICAVYIIAVVGMYHYTTLSMIGTYFARHNFLSVWSKIQAFYWNAKTVIEL